MATVARLLESLGDSILIPFQQIILVVQSAAAVMAEYLDSYGFRCINELKLEEYSLRDRPEMVFQVLRNYLQLEDQSVLDVEAMKQREQTVGSEQIQLSPGLVKRLQELGYLR